MIDWVKGFWTKVAAVLLGAALFSIDAINIFAFIFYCEVGYGNEYYIERYPKLTENLLKIGESAPGKIIYLSAAILLILIFLARVSGRHMGEKEVKTSFLEAIPFDLFTVAIFGIEMALFYFLIESAPFIFENELGSFYLFYAASFVMMSIFEAYWMSFCVRIKLRCLIKETLFYKLLCFGCQVIKYTISAIRVVMHSIPLIVKTLIVTSVWAIAIGIAVSNESDEIIFILCMLAIISICYCAMQMHILKRGGEALANGDLSHQVDSSKMILDFKDHAENLNSISRGMANAVEERMKSERMKTELITNVSHDIKTPLTSIINYADLLSKDHTKDEEKEYIEVLSRQSKKLKKLTEDLIEMSKASSGNIPCHLASTNVEEFIEQAVAEYGEKLAISKLELVTSINGKFYCMADGSLLWRIFDNILGNVCKYAQSSTRVYLEAKEEGSFIEFSVKNISRDSLNISADELMERFVRGDSSRNTEGSGLGLSIAQSLTELMGGTFNLYIDGDLFKVVFRIPKA